jgi:hypothetical protein
MPVVLASQRQRDMMVKQMMVPFYNNVTQAMWRAGSYQPEQFCRDKARAARLYDTQVGVPIPTQIRYFLEYMTSDVATRFAQLDMPILIVQPQVEWTLDLAVNQWKKSNEMMYGSVSAAKKQFETMFKQVWGDVQTGVRWTWDGVYQWEHFRGMASNMTIEFVKNSGIFVMEDQPEKLDAIIRTFVDAIRRSKE